MKRIDTVNARPNVNGVGKTGFHDNADVSGQDATYLSPDWLNHLQEELCNLLEKNGIALDANNRQQLFNLLATYDDVEYLATQIQSLLNNKYDKFGGQINGNVAIEGSATIVDELTLKDKITIDTTEGSTRITHSNNELYIDTTLDRIHFMKPVYTGGHAPSPNGWTLLTNGYILQWGEQDYASEPGEINVTVNFPISFPNNCFAITPIRKAIASTTNADGGVYLVSKNESSAELLLQRYNSDSVHGLRGFSWIAIGN